MKRLNASQYRPWIAVGLRWLLGGLFVWAGVLKLIDPQVFADRIAAFQMLPNSMINLTALSLPPLEMISGTLLILGWQRKAATSSVVLMSAVFLVALVSAQLRGLAVECGCFGDSFASWGTDFAIARDILLLLLSMYLYRQQAPEALEVAPATGKILR